SPKKKKKKFNYSSFPAPKRSAPPPTNLPQVDASSQTIPAKSRAAYEAAAQAKDSAALAKEEGSQRWWFAAIALIAVAGVVYLAFFAPDPGKTAGESVSTSAPAVTPPQPEPPQGLPPAGPKLT